MTKPNFTHIVAILDKSGSMKPVQDDTIGGFNTFLDEQKKVPGEATLTLVQFSDKCQTTYSDVPLAHVALLTKDTYCPNGWTALNDSLAKTINDVGMKLAAKPEHDRPSKVVFLIMTDGAENTSKEFGGTLGLAKVSEMVKHQKDKYSWDFVFMGANMDAFATGISYGIPSTYAINYTSDKLGSYNAFKSASRGMTASRLVASAGGTLDMFFENEASKHIVSNDTLDVSNIQETINKYTPSTTTTAPTNDTTTPIK